MALHLHNQAKLFLNNVTIKELKSIYNNEEVAFGIRRYIFEYIQNLDKVLTDLKRAGITIPGAKSQFYQAELKIVGYICDMDGRYPNTSKILKILDWPKCINITFVYAFMGVCIYY